MKRPRVVAGPLGSRRFAENSHEAGVLWEVIDAIEHPETGKENNVVVDVLTGASAGGMTAIILAQKLLYNRSEFAGPYDNPLYNTWVKGISLEGLQATGNDEKALQSIFSSDLIEAISKEALLKRYQTARPAPEPHPAVDGELRVGVALTNLNGISYGYKVKPMGEFSYLDYSDQLTRHVVAAQCDKPEFWEALRKAAVACGSFPFAFRTQSFERSKEADPSVAWRRTHRKRRC